MNKFQRNFKLYVDEGYNDPEGKKVLIEPPFSLEFSINRNTLASASDGSFRVYNLGRSVRDKIFRDHQETGRYKGVELKAGYGDLLPTIFRGNVNAAYSAREGVNYITQIDGQDGGHAKANSTIEESYTANTGVTQTTILKALAGSMQDSNIKIGVISPSFNQVSPRGVVLSGYSSDILNQVGNNGVFIDLEKIYALKKNEAITGSLEELEPDTLAILGTPIREEHLLRLDVLFEPRLIAGQYLKLKSFTETRFNGEYKLVSLHHRGVISEGMAGTATTSLGLWYGEEKILKVQ